MNLIGKNVVVYGAGISGQSAYQLIKDKGGNPVLFDDNKSLDINTSKASVFSLAELIVLSPGISCQKEFLLDAKLGNKIVIGELELASSLCDAMQIAVTGTNGKTTTCMLIDHILKCSNKSSRVVGNIGVAFSGIADNLDRDDIAIIEASSFQLESSIKFQPHIACILNITPDHLDRHENIDKYAMAKANIFKHQTEDDYVIYNADDKIISGFYDDMNAKKIPFSLKRPVDGAYMSSGFICYKGKPIIESCETDLRGFEIENVLCSVAVAMVCGISPFMIALALSTFVRPDYRRKVVAEIEGIKFFNDSKATNINATLSAVCSMQGKSVLILGGSVNGEDFKSFFENLKFNKISSIVVCGDNSDIIQNSASKLGIKNLHIANTLEEAVLLAVEMAENFNAKNILFSPASKSFDRYKNYQQRGEHFNTIIESLLK